MDLGIAGRTAVVCGSSEGLGKACAAALLEAGAAVIVNGRRREALEVTVEALKTATGGEVRAVVADVSTQEGRTTLLEACADPDILVNNSAGPPPGSFDDWDEAAWMAALGANMVGPIMLTRAVLGPMRARRWGRVINITSSAVKAPLPLLGLSNGARSGLTGFIAGLAREVAGDGVTINNLLPGTFETGRLRSYAGAVAAKEGSSADEVLARLARSNPSGRLGQAEEFGAACAFLASRHAGYITGQSLLLDGGAYPGVF